MFDWVLNILLFMAIVSLAYFSQIFWKFSEVFFQNVSRNLQAYPKRNINEILESSIYLILDLFCEVIPLLVNQTPKNSMKVAIFYFNTFNEDF